jgi:DNA mismatch repair ATPase MutL
VLEHIRKQWPDLGRAKFPTCVVELNMNPQDLDVNLEPDKSKILVNAEKEVKTIIFYLLVKFIFKLF